jgi:dihydrodipicolinate synthase/N-acetylneuraminate lyase
VFGKNGIDNAAQEKLIERLIAAEVDGILFCGSIGEFHAMPLQQKKDFFTWAAKAVAGRVKALAGTGGCCVPEVMELTAHAADCGMDGAVVMSPYYFLLNDDSLYRYYTAVASVGLPLMLYNFPARTGISLSPSLVHRLAVEQPAIVGIKDTVDTISHTRELIAAIKPARPEFSILSGYDEYLIPNLMAGGDGILTGMTNVAPQVFVALRRAYRASDSAGVIRLQAVVNKLMALYAVTDPFIAAIKAAVDLVAGGISPTMLPPALEANAEERAKIAAILTDAGLL